jgi:hypothetical protein
MKLFTLLLLSLAACAAASAQTGPYYVEAPGVALGGNHWGVRTRNASPDLDPLAASREQLARDQIRRDGATRQSGGMVVGETPRVSPFHRTPPTAAVGYFFESEVKNTGRKRIRTVVWEYIFFDRETGAVADFRAFRSEVNLKPGKSAKIEGWLPLRAAEVARAARTVKESRGKFLERVFISRLEYDDGTGWARDAK